MSIYEKFYFRPSPGEWIHTELSPGESGDCGIIGRVKDEEGEATEALVLLFEADGKKVSKLVSASVTDEDGGFAFGPLKCGGLYIIKVYRDSLKLRELEISV